MVKYDYSKVDRILLEQIAAFANARGESWSLLEEAKRQARVLTRQEYDKQIADLMREFISPQMLNAGDFHIIGADVLKLRALVEASRHAI